MLRKSVKIEIDEWMAHDVIVNELLYERSLLKKPANHIANKKETIAAIETVLDYFSTSWRDKRKR